MIVTDIKPQAKNSKRVNLYLDGKFYCGLELFTVMKHRVKIGNDYTANEIIDIQIAEEEGVCLNYALNLLSKSVKTEKEIIAKLKKRGYVSEIIDNVIFKLKDYGYVNDEEFAEKYINSYSKNKGKRLLKSELKLKGVSDAIIEDKFLSVENELETAIKIAEKYVKNKPVDIKTKQKCYKYLLSKGFSYDDSKTAVDKVLSLDDEF